MQVILNDGLSQYEAGKLRVYEPGDMLECDPHIGERMIEKGWARLPHGDTQTPPDAPISHPAPNPPPAPKRGAGRPKKG